MLTRRKTVRKYIRFYGQVQAVGFRWTAMQAAKLYGVTGWVRNEYDGSVQAELQGLPEEIDMIIQRLCQDRYIEIRSMDRKELPLDETERGFHVKY